MIIKEIKSITKLEGVYGRNIRTDRWSINFTDGSNMVVKGAIPFEIVGSIGMMVQIFKYKKFKTVLFGWPKNKGSIALLVCYEWSTMFGFNNCRKVWKENYWLKPGGRVLDKRKPGKPVALNVTNKGDILSP